MKGDLSTLKKVCMYGSKVMLAGTAVIGIVIALLIVLGIGSLFSDGMMDVLRSCMGSQFEDGTSAKASASYMEMLLVFILAIVTVFSTYRIMVSIQTEHSPFTEINTLRVKQVSVAYLVSAVVFLVIEAIKSGEMASMAFMFFGCILIAVVLYMVALIIRYGSLLQDESDHTL